jgi:hypothetical protein
VAGAAVQLGDETLRRDDAAALLDPVTERFERNASACNGTFTSPRVRGRTPSVRLPRAPRMGMRLDELDRHKPRTGVVVVPEEDEDLSARLDHALAPGKVFLGTGERQSERP